MLTGVTTLLEAADELYAVALPEFTPARDALAKSLKGEDRELSNRIKALKKPSTAAWVVNLLARRDPDQVDQVLQVGESLREAQASLDGDELRALTRQRRQLTAALTQQASGMAREHGLKVTGAVAEQVEATLTAAMVDAAAGQAVRSGLLVASIVSTGVVEIDLREYVAVPDALDFTPTRLDEASLVAPTGPPELHVVPDPDAEEKRIAAAREALDEADLELATVNESLESAVEDVHALEARTLQLQAEIDELRRRLGELESEQDEVDDELSDARSVVESAREDVDVARAAKSRAAEAVDRLT